MATQRRLRQRDRAERRGVCGAHRAANVCANRVGVPRRRGGDRGQCQHRTAPAQFAPGGERGEHEQQRAERPGQRRGPHGQVVGASPATVGTATKSRLDSASTASAQASSNSFR